jgi:hypothetical protein
MAWLAVLFLIVTGHISAAIFLAILSLSAAIFLAILSLLFN